MEEEEEDPFSFITQQATVPDYQTQILRTLRFLGEEEEQQTEMYHTPEEHLPSLSEQQQEEEQKGRGKGLADVNTCNEVDVSKKRKFSLGVSDADASTNAPLGSSCNSARLPTVHGFRKLPNWSEDQFEVGPGSRRKRASSSSFQGPTVASSSSASRGGFVSLTDLVDPKEDDVLVAAIKAGWNIPLPRFWRS